MKIAIALLALSLALIGSASAQDAPQVGALVSLDTHVSGAAGLSFEVDAELQETPLSFVGHMGAVQDGAHAAAGLRVGHALGPVRVFGHWLYGAVGLGADAETNAVHRPGAGIDVTLRDGMFLRFGLNADRADGGVSWNGVVGFGVRF